MKLDLSKIEKEKVGYILRADSIEGPNYLEVLTLGEFINPYSYGANTPREVHDRLSIALKKSITQQDSVTDKKRPVMTDVLASATLEREAIMNSMSLIERHYLNKM
jgi:hypothetical protein